jgi:hypothetical protein
MGESASVVENPRKRKHSDTEDAMEP